MIDKDQRIADLEEENAKLRHVVRRQGAFIQDMKERIRDFRGHPSPSLGRPIADRGLRGRR